jgi:hypothetical protein
MLGMGSPIAQAEAGAVGDGNAIVGVSTYLKAVHVSQPIPIGSFRGHLTVI